MPEVKARTDLRWICLLRILDPEPSDLAVVLGRDPWLTEDESHETSGNVCFGGPKRNRLFMAASQSLYAVPGISFSYPVPTLWASGSTFALALPTVDHAGSVAALNCSIW